MKSVGALLITGDSGLGKSTCAWFLTGHMTADKRAFVDLDWYRKRETRGWHRIPRGHTIYVGSIAPNDPEVKKLNIQRVLIPKPPFEQFRANSLRRFQLHSKNPETPQRWLEYWKRNSERDRASFNRMIRGLVADWRKAGYHVSIFEPMGLKSPSTTVHFEKPDN